MVRRLAPEAYSLRLHKDDPMKGILLELHVHEDTEEGVAFVDHFKATCFEHLGASPDRIHWFLQGQSSEWLMFEFWTRDAPAIQRAVARVENALREEGLTVNFQNCLTA